MDTKEAKETREAAAAEDAADTAPAAQPEDAPEAPQQDHEKPAADAKAAKDSAKPRKKDKADKTQTEALRREIEQLKQQLNDEQDQYKRMLAEYMNYKRRTEQEKEQLGLFTKAEVLKALLPPLDNLERAVEAPAGEEYKKGVDMTIRQLHEALAGLGLEEIEAQDAAFDPEVHNAVMREDADGVEPDTVTAVFQKGYKVGDRLLRPAMVKVAN